SVSGGIGVVICSGAPRIAGRSSDRPASRIGATSSVQASAMLLVRAIAPDGTRSLYWNVHHVPWNPGGDQLDGCRPGSHIAGRLEVHAIRIDQPRPADCIDRAGGSVIDIDFDRRGNGAGALRDCRKWSSRLNGRASLAEPGRENDQGLTFPRRP